MFVKNITRKFLPFLLLIAGLAQLVLGIRPIYAEFVCASEVSYKWKKGEKESSVSVSRIERRGADEAAGKAALEESLSREKSDALDECRKQHENMAGCMSAKFTSNSDALRSMSFPARKQLEEAVGADCKEGQGSCTEAATSEAVCREIKKAETTDAAKADTAKKDEKGKGKKK